MNWNVQQVSLDLQQFQDPRLPTASSLSTEMAGDSPKALKSNATLALRNVDGLLPTFYFQCMCIYKNMLF